MGSYTVSFVKRLVGPALPMGETDPVTKLVKVEVFLDFRYGLLLSELAIRNSLEWLPFVVGKYIAHLTGATQSILLRTWVTVADRKTMFPLAFSYGRGMEDVMMYLDPAFIIQAAEERIQRTHDSLGVHGNLRSRKVWFWGRQTNTTLLSNVTLLVLTSFDSAAPKRLCLEHFSSSPSPTPVETCPQLVDCLKNFLSFGDLSGRITCIQPWNGTSRPTPTLSLTGGMRRTP